jgi:hypothetical protein
VRGAVAVYHYIQQKVKKENSEEKEANSGERYMKR